MKIMSFKKRPRLSFVGLLFWFLVFFLISPLLTNYTGAMIIQISFTILLLFTVFTLTQNKKAMLIGGITALISTICNSYNLYSDTFWTELLALTSSLVFVLFTVIYLFRRVFLIKTVDLDLIFGSICVYILLAVCWALIYGFIEFLSPGSFRNILPQAELSHTEGGIMGPKFHAFLYFSFVTQTALGYGDITPITPLARSYASIQAIMGIFYLATIVGSLVSMFIATEKKLLKSERESR